jgi:hypothetical protein
VKLVIVWHVCSDHLLMSLLTEMGGAGCTKPCFLCDWNRDHPDGLRQDGSLRCLEFMRHQAEWRASCVQPILIAEQQKSATKKAKEAMLDSDAQDKVQVVSLPSRLTCPFFACSPWVTNELTWSL